MKKQQIAVLVATYNGEKYLEQQINSLLNQSCQDFMIYLHDDGSTDDTNSLIDKLVQKNPNKIVRLNYSKQGCAAANFISMLKCVEEPYAMFCDQDDIWMENKIELEFNRLLEMEAYWGKDVPCLVFTDLKVVDADLGIISNSFMKHTNHNPGDIEYRKLLMKNVAPGCTMILNRALIDYVTMYQNINNIQMHDRWAILLASIFGRIEYLSKATILYRQHENNTVGAKQNGIIQKIGDNLHLLFSGVYFKEKRNWARIPISLSKELIECFTLPAEAETFLKTLLDLENQSKIKRIAFYKKNGLISSRKLWLFLYV